LVCHVLSPKEERGGGGFSVGKQGGNVKVGERREKELRGKQTNKLRHGEEEGEESEITMEVRE
jgi:hypothetical protein